MGLRRAFLQAAAVAAFLVPAQAHATTVAKPPVVWLKSTDRNYTDANRSPASIDRVVVHVTEGSFWGSVSWLRNPRAHASSHFVVSQRGKIVQLVNTADIAWHAGHWGTNVRSIGIEHEGYTYGPQGFTQRQYHASAKLTAWAARRSLMPIDRRTIVGHHEVPDGHGGRGGASHHTDPGPNWRWGHYISLVKRYAGVQKPRVAPLVPEGPLRGIVSLRAKAAGGIKRVQFLLDGRVVHVDARPPYAYTVNTTKLSNRRYRFQVHGIAGPGRYDVEGATIAVDNKTFALTSAGARAWMPVLRPVKMRVRPWGAKAKSITFYVNGKRRAVDRKAPYWFAWPAKRAKYGRHVLLVVAESVDGRTARQRIPVVVPQPLKPKARPKPAARPVPPPPPLLAIAGQSLAEGQEVPGFTIWRVDVKGKATRVEFLVDGVLRGTDLAAPYTLGWDASAEAAGPHRLTARAVGAKTVEKTVTVSVPPPPAAGGTAAP
jgi:N-acetyl-anhydromuramyl-L-alanine amidase AmpD